MTTIALTLRYGALTAIATSVAAFTTSTLIVALNANWLTLFVSTDIIRLIASTAFIALGIITLVESFKKSIISKEVGKIQHLRYLVLFGMLILAELGDKTQLSVFSLSISIGLIPTIIGGITGYTIINSAAISISKILKTKINLRLTMRISSILFIIIGVSMMFLIISELFT
ncbi:MAG: hypothetical protein DRO15_03820 [Thermoprotei archaeon]|nr:MAG: hypothetical protein DRO15_03820 [Thermoprotei archaeon]